MDPKKDSPTFTSTAAVKQLQHRLNEDRTAMAIDRLLDRIDVLEKAVSNLSSIIEQGPGFLAMTTDMVDDTYSKAQANGINIEQRLSAALHLANKLTAPEMIEKLDRLIALSNQVPGLAAMSVDIVDETYHKMNSQGINLEQRLQAVLNLANQLTAPQRLEQFENLIKLADQAPGLIAMVTDILDEEVQKANDIDVPALLNLAKQLSTAVSKSQEIPPTKVGGIFSMLRTMRDPDRQRAIGLIMNIVKAWGKEIKAN